jgi:hypothetical protein
MEGTLQLVRGNRLLETDGPDHLVPKHPVVDLHVSIVHFGLT